MHRRTSGALPLCSSISVSIVVDHLEQDASREAMPRLPHLIRNLRANRNPAAQPALRGMERGLARVLQVEPAELVKLPPVMPERAKRR